MDVSYFVLAENINGIVLKLISQFFLIGNNNDKYLKSYVSMYIYVCAAYAYNDL